MPFEIGNIHWALRESDDLKQPLLRPHELIERFKDYIEHLQNNPIKVNVIQQKTGAVIEVPRARPWSVKGFCLHAGIAQNTFYGYANRDGYKNICKVIQDAVYVQKFEGAAVGIFNAPMIMRDIGLNDTVNHTLEDNRKTVEELFPSIEEIEAVEVPETSPEEIKKLNDAGASSED